MCSGPSEPVTSESGSAPRIVDFDIFCLSCGYNLRGLSGDPVRCPECAQLNVLGDTAEIPESLIAARLRRAEAAPLIGVAAVLFARPWQFLFWSLLVEGLRGGLGRNAVGEILSCPGVPAFAPLLVWAGAIFWFRASCLGQSGWGRLLRRYHLFGLSAGGAMLVMMLLIPAIWSPLGRGMRIWNYIVPVIVFGGAIVAVRRFLVAPHRRLMVDIHDLQRPAAISAICEEARRRATDHP